MLNLIERLQRPMPTASSLELTDRCLPAPTPTKLPTNDSLVLKGRKPSLTARQEADVAAIEMHQQRLLADAIKADAPIMEALKNWGSLPEAQKLGVLRRIAALEGQAFGFTPAPMTLDRKAKKGDYGAYDGETRKIELGAWGLKDKDPRDLVDTVIHEQLHALQHQRYTAMAAGAIAKSNPQNAQARVWLYNNNHYHEYDKGPKAYRQQPLEAHAWDGAGAITDRIFGKKQP